MGEFLTKKTCFPQDIVEEIFLRLPVKSLIRFRCVSKQCQAFIFEPGFVRLHHQRACEDTRTSKFIVSNEKKLWCIDGEAIFNNGIIDDDFAAVDAKFITSRSSPLCNFSLNSCEGLVIVYISEINREPHGPLVKYHIHLWNPLTGHYKRLPDFTKGFLHSSFGFGYDYSRNDYKIISPFFYRGNKNMHCMVFSLRANSWRTIDLGFTRDDMMFPAISGKFLNGAIHWLVWTKTLLPQQVTGSERKPRLIAYFDVASEKIHPLQAPPHDPNHVLDFGILKGCLCVCIPDCERNIDVWIMKEYKEVSSWTKVAYLHCSIVLALDYPRLTPLYLLENGEALMLSYEGILSVYNFRESKSRRVFNSTHFFKAIRHVESLFPFWYFKGLDCEISRRKNKSNEKVH